MPYNANDAGDFGSFVPLLQHYDLDSLAQAIKRISVVINSKETGLYLEQEVLNSNVWFSTTALNPQSPSESYRRQEYTKVVNFGAVGAGINPGVAHGLVIGANWVFTEIRGVATNAVTNHYYPLPWTGAAGFISLELTATNVVINNTSGLAFPQCLVVLKYLKQ